MSDEEHLLEIAQGFVKADELPFAIVYYGRAGAKTEVTLLQEKLGIHETVKEPLLSTTASLYLFAVFSILLGISGSLWIWRRTKLYLRATIVISLTLSFLLTHLFITSYFSPVTAVVIQGTVLYTAPDNHAERVSNRVLMPGSTVEAFELEKEGFWLKVATPEGVVGYLPASKVRLF